jgi:peptide/nickel transport system permease protein
MTTAALDQPKNQALKKSGDTGVATQWVLMWRKFRRHKLAMFGTVIVIVFYLIALFCEFVATQDPLVRDTDYIHMQPQRVHFMGANGFGPFVYGVTFEEDARTWRRNYVEDTSVEYPIHFFAKTEPYEMWGFITLDRRLMSTDEGPFFLFGTDDSGRDLYSRTMYGIRVSMSVGLVGVFFTFLLGVVLGSISGYYGGTVDFAIQRLIEFILCIPAIPLWMALSAAVPKSWSSERVYFAISIILSLIAWCALARVVRGKMLELRNEDYISASRLSGGGDGWLIFNHLLPGISSYLIVSLTLAIPAMLLAETSLSFLGLGLRPPAISLGVLLQQAQNIQAIAAFPWLMIPAVFIFIIVLAFNFMGDGLRDAADPYR